MTKNEIVLLKAITQAGSKDNWRDPYEYLETNTVSKISEKINKELEGMGYIIVRKDTLCYLVTIVTLLIDPENNSDITTHEGE